MKSADWENPSVTGKNRLPPHADRDYPLRMSLNGTWQFGSFLPEDLERITTLELPYSQDVHSCQDNPR